MLAEAVSLVCEQAEAMGHEGMAAKIMAKHSREEHRSSLSITVIEARGLRPRHGMSCSGCTVLHCPDAFQSW